MTRTKAEWRRVLLAARSAIDTEARRAFSAGIADRVAALLPFERARTLFGYVAIGAEADPQNILKRSRASKIFVPASGDSSDDPSWIAWGTAELSAPHCPVIGPEGFPAVILVPGVGFDEAGMRLGRGQGFYDRALAALRRSGDVCAIGLAFEAQIVSELPADPWDQGMDYVVSDKRIVRSARWLAPSGAAPPR